MDILQQVSGVAFVFLLLGGVVWALRKGRTTGAMRLPWARRTVARPGKQLELLERLPLTPQHSLHFVRVAETTYLIATHAGGTTMLPVCDTGNFHAAFTNAIVRQDAGGTGTCA